jgi:hypothetical protein
MSACSLHAAHTKLPRRLFLSKNLGVDALSVVPHPKTKFPLFMSDFHFDLPRLCLRAPESTCCET